MGGRWAWFRIPVLLCNVSLAMLDPLVAVKMFDTYHLLLLYRLAWLHTVPYYSNRPEKMAATLSRQHGPRYLRTVIVALLQFSVLGFMT